MATHIADIPKPFYCYVANEFLYDQQEGFGEYTDCVAYGISALPSRAWGISIMTDIGALVQHVPVHALTTNPPKVHYHGLDELQIWSCYGWDFATHEYDFLSEMPVRVYLKGGVWESGRYLFTAAPYGDEYSATPDQHKHFNFIELECGQICAYPGNRCLFYDSSFTEPPTERPKYRTNTRTWYVEEIGEESAFDSQITPETSL
ncbi:MAG: hypothetical protein EBV30_06950 [Actinobacteria bacterium]|nr:hypothetical protein [Actinomycetota bacterium]NBO54038.1 hypothetical protein [Actinomycetota bacterium]